MRINLLPLVAFEFVCALMKHTKNKAKRICKKRLYITVNRLPNTGFNAHGKTEKTMN